MKKIYLFFIALAMIFCAAAIKAQTETGVQNFSNPPVTGGEGGNIPAGQGGSMPAGQGGMIPAGQGGNIPPGGQYSNMPYQPNQMYQTGPDSQGSFNGQQPMMGPQGGGDGMQRWLKDMQRVVPSLEKRMATLEKRGYKIPQAAKDAMSKMKEMLEKAKAGTEESDLDMGETSQLMEDINQGIQQAEMASRFSSQIKEVERQIKLFNSSFARAQKRAKIMKTDISGFMSEWQNLLSEISAAKDQAKQKISEGDVEAAIDLMSSEINDKMEEAGDKQRVFDLISNTNQIIRQINTDIKMLEKYLLQAKKKGDDTTHMQELINQGKADAQKLKDILSRAPIDSELLIQTLEELYDAKAEFMDEFQDSASLMPLAPMQNYQMQQTPMYQQPMMQGGYGNIPNNYQQNSGFGQQPSNQNNLGPLNFLGQMQASIESAFNSFIASLPIF